MLMVTASFLALTLAWSASVWAEDEVCWRETEGRGIATIPRQCDLVEERKMLTCYEHCRDGYTGLIAKCRKDCPEGFKEGALNYCVKSENYRVDGFPWKAGDGLGRYKLTKAKQRCDARHGAGNCVQRQGAFYPRCRAGFRQQGVNICAQACPAGWQVSGNRCLRPSYVREKSRPRCEDGKEFRAGLCRNACPDGYNGVGPVCWAECPAEFPARCGMACATSEGSCAEAIIDQVMSVVEVAAQIALLVVTAGGSSAATATTGGATAATGAATTASTTAATTTAQTAARTGARQALRAAGRSLAKFTKKQLREALQDAITDPELLTDTVEALFSISAGEASDESAGDKALEVFAAIDPTGISGIVSAYKKPICPLPAAATLGSSW
jgi:hypothetical protein